jgi:hypothetical protein
MGAVARMGGFTRMMKEVDGPAGLGIVACFWKVCLQRRKGFIASPLLYGELIGNKWSGFLVLLGVLRSVVDEVCTRTRMFSRRIATLFAS